MTNSAARNIHQGRNIKRFREMLGIKQDALAHELGEDWSQKKISLLEQKESIEENILKEVAEILHIPVEAIQNFDEEQAVNIISNTFNDQSNGYNYYPTFNINPFEKWIEAMDEIKRLNEEKIAMYERMLKEKDEMIVRLERLTGK
ncbi:XRE family transcriptional regulator [Echinicola strongylocentroti]|uniref:XRE family transcriptional regulator n=1 Tax=Echinicola strongylocentroti TaxID=1795355 RepID=A0A2Z4IGB9_9BACT|nr:helix-turn-helix transcriptional regulator [Echinicola strongylocentroti]AWW30152.1 XRE family transcriptional regulator [Echinicola strongylocentroti]